MARIRAIVRRSNGHAQSVLNVGDLCVNLDAKTVTIGGVHVHLTRKEYQILELLSLRKGSTAAWPPASPFRSRTRLIAIASRNGARHFLAVRPRVRSPARHDGEEDSQCCLDGGGTFPRESLRNFDEREIAHFRPMTP